MKKTIFFAFFTLFFVGCSTPNVVNLPANRAISDSVAANMYVYIGQVADKREDMQVAGVIKNADGSANEYVMYNQNLASWVKGALSNELKRRNLGVTDDKSAADATIDVSINKCESTLVGFDRENLKGECEIFYAIKRGNTTYTKRVAQSQSEFKIIKNAEAFTPFSQNLLRDVIEKSANLISQTLK